MERHLQGRRRIGGGRAAKGGGEGFGGQRQRAVQLQQRPLQPARIDIHVARLHSTIQPENQRLASISMLEMLKVFLSMTVMLTPRLQLS